MAPIGTRSAWSLARSGGTLRSRCRLRPFENAFNRDVSSSTDAVPAAPLQLIVIPRRPGDRWELAHSYVEVVWAEILGPTATSIGRRLAEAVSQGCDVELPFEAVSAALGVPRRRALEGLRRLHHYGLVEFLEVESIVGLSGLVPSVSERHAAALCRYTAARRDVLERAGAGSSR